jgi:plastocyanin
MLNPEPSHRAGRRLSALIVAGALLTAACSGAAPTTAPAAPSAQVAMAAPSATQAPTPKPTAAPTATPAATPTVAPTPTFSGDPNAKDSHVTDNLVVVNTRYAPTELTAPANMKWHVNIDDQEVAANGPIGTLHNFTLSSGAQKLFQTATWGPGERTFDIPGLPAGLYVFTCSFHPAAMHGTVEIK